MRSTESREEVVQRIVICQIDGRQLQADFVVGPDCVLKDSLQVGRTAIGELREIKPTFATTVFS